MTRLILRPRIPRLIALLMAALAGFAVLAQDTDTDRPRRILHVMSFDSPWRWTDGQLAGFKAGLGDPSAEIRVFQLDTKHNQTQEAKERKGGEARALIETWKPDLVYTSDDDALDLVTRHYVGQSLPFVFSGVNKDMHAHGLEWATNVTGVLEREHFVQSVRLLQTLVPDAKRLAVICDSANHWAPVIGRIQAQITELPGTTLAAVDRVETYEAFKRKVLAYPRIADAVLYLGIFTLTGDDGAIVPYQQVQRWTVEHSRLPELSFWIDRIFYGVLAAVTVSEWEQGLAAGRLARAILVDGQAPASLPIESTRKGHPAINLARARQLGIPVSSTLLLSSEVVTGFDWEKTPP